MISVIKDHISKNNKSMANAIISLWQSIIHGAPDSEKLTLTEYLDQVMLECEISDCKLDA